MFGPAVFRGADIVSDQALNTNQNSQLVRMGRGGWHCRQTAWVSECLAHRDNNGQPSGLRQIRSRSSRNCRI